jgi:hypothetical protein
MTIPRTTWRRLAMVGKLYRHWETRTFLFHRAFWDDCWFED